MSRFAVFRLKVLGQKRQRQVRDGEVMSSNNHVMRALSKQVKWRPCVLIYVLFV